MKKFQAFQERSTPAYRIVFTRYTVKRCYRIVSSPGLICLMVNSLMRWWLCSLRVQCSETQSDWNNRSYDNIRSKLVQIHIFSLNYYRTPFWQSQKQHTRMVIYKKNLKQRNKTSNPIPGFLKSDNTAIVETAKFVCHGITTKSEIK